MTAVKTPDQLEAEKQIEAELDRLGWLCTNETPCYYVVDTPEMSPKGWVRLYDDNTDLHGPADEILAALKDLRPDAEYGSGLDFDEKPPENSRDWPEDLFETTQLDEGTPNDHPNTLVRITTNGGDKFTAGPHGTFECAASAAFQHNGWRDTAEQADPDQQYDETEGD